MHNTKYCNIEYLNERNAVFCQWKQFCKLDDYRQPFKYGLKLINEHKATVWITDTTYGFENIEEDTQWLMEVYMPKLINSSLKKIVFIIEKDSHLKKEIDEQTKALSEYFIVKQIERFVDLEGVIEV